MIGYIARRLVASFLILIGVTMVTFALTFMIPADPVAMLAGRNATAQTREQIRHQLGLDRPLPVQYITYVARLAVGDFGKSYARKTDVADLIASRLPPTLLLMLGAILAELMIGIPAGIYAASRRGSGADKVAMTLSFVTVSTPQFVVGLTLLYVFAYLLSWFPLSGYGSLSNLILPALTLGMAGGGWYSRMMRSSMIEVLRQDYIRTARAKGMGERRVLLGSWPAQRCAADHRHDRSRHRHLHVGRGGGRERVRLAGDRSAHVAGDPVARHSHHHGCHHRRRLVHCARQFPG